MRRNLGKKNCELADADIERILKHYLDQPPANSEVAKAVPECKWFDNADFGYWKITVERLLRLESQLKRSAIESLRFATGGETLRSEIYAKYGDKLYTEFNAIKGEVEAWLKSDDGDEDAEDESEDDAKTTKKSVPEKRRKKLIDPATWPRDKTLVELAKLGSRSLANVCSTTTTSSARALTPR